MSPPGQQRQVYGRQHHRDHQRLPQRDPVSRPERVVQKRGENQMVYIKYWL